MCCLVPPFPVPFHYPASFPLSRWFAGFYPFPLVCFVGVLIADPCVFGLIGFACAWVRHPPALCSLIASWLQLDYWVLYIQPRNVCGTLLAACFVI